MINTYDTAAARREKDLAALAMMKEIEAKRKMKSVRVDTRTIIGGSARSIRERLKSLRPAPAIPKKKGAPVRQRLMAERSAIFRRIFGDLDTMPRIDIVARLRTDTLTRGQAADKLINYAENNGIIRRIGKKTDRIYQLNIEEQ